MFKKECRYLPDKPEAGGVKKLSLNTMKGIQQGGLQHGDCLRFARYLPQRKRDAAESRDEHFLTPNRPIAVHEWHEPVNLIACT
jgi:hypothetical protein